MNARAIIRMANALHARTCIAIALALLFVSTGLRGAGVLLHSHAGGGHHHVHRNDTHHRHAHEHAHTDGHHHHHGGHSHRDEPDAMRHDDAHEVVDAITVFRTGLEVRAANAADDAHWHTQDPHAPALRPVGFALGAGVAVSAAHVPFIPGGVRLPIHFPPVRGPPHRTLL